MSLISESNKEQKEAIMHGDGPLLIIAGAGTGKTRVITARIAWLITEKNINVDEILALTFTEKAANEMQERVDTMLPYGYVDLWISTFHSFCDKVLKRHALDIGLPNNYKLLDTTAAWLLVRENLDKFNLDYYRPIGSPNKFIHALLKHFSRCKDECISAKDYLAYAEELKLNSDSASYVKKLDLDLEDLSKSEKKELVKQEILRINEIANAYHVYQQLLIDNDALDFSDLINYTIELFKKRPAILQKYRKQFKYIMVDEFQDTNTSQYELIKMLASPKNNITVVGDDDQSIYKFRGASIANIMEFKSDYPKSKEIVLSENYRSCQEILDLSYKFIVQNNPDRLEEKLGINKALKAHLEDECQIKHLHFATAEDEAREVVNKIIEIRNQKKCEWSDFAILVRANDSAEMFINYLYQNQVPYQFMAMRGLYTKPVILDAINYFKLLDNYHESSAVFRVLNFAHYKVAPDQVIKLVHYAKKKSWSLYETVKQCGVVPGITPNTVDILNSVITRVEKDTDLAQKAKPSEVFLSFIYKSGYLQALTKQESLQNKEKINHLQQFFKRIQSHEQADENASLSSFVELIQMEMEAGESGKLEFDPEVGPDMVRIMTVHGAKGLEFDHVFLANLVDRKFPTDERRELIEIPNALLNIEGENQDFHLHEERRLFYVAITRAKKSLYFTSADNYGGVRDKKLSRFLLELDYSKPELQKSEKVKIQKIDPVEKTEIKEVLPKAFSFSQMQTYEMCPYKYMFANVLKIPTFGNHYFTFGSVIHNSLQKFLEMYFMEKQQDLFEAIENKDDLPKIEKLLEIYDENWSDDWYQDAKQKDEYYKKGKELLKNFYNNFTKEKPKVQSLEQPFKLKLGDYFFSGRIDRIDQAKDGVEIIDYKTGSAKGEKLSASDKRQLLFYQMAAEEVLKLKVSNLKYYYLEDEKNPEREFLGQQKDKEKLRAKFLDNIESIKKQRFEPKPSPQICKFCDYKDICEYKKL